MTVLFFTFLLSFLKSSFVFHFVTLIRSIAANEHNNELDLPTDSTHELYSYCTNERPTDRASVLFTQTKLLPNFTAHTTANLSPRCGNCERKDGFYVRYSYAKETHSFSKGGFILGCTLGTPMAFTKRKLVH